jgi:hypothetical protein
MRILDNGLATVDGRFHAAWCEVEDQGRRYYRAAVLRELAVLTDDPQSRVRGSEDGILGKMWGAVSGLYNAGVNLVYAACGIYRPEHIGVVQLYGAAATAETKAQAIARAERDFAAVAATLAGFAQSKLEPPALDVVRWYVEFLSAARKPLLLLGHPDPRVKRRAHGRDGALPEEADDLSAEQNEILFRGLAKLRENFVFQVVSDHVPRGELVRYLEDMARLASNFASRRRGSKSIGLSVSLPVFNALAHGYSGGGGQAVTRAHGTADGVTQGWGEAETHSRAHSVTNGTSVSDGVTEVQSAAQTLSRAHTESTAQTISRAVSDGTSTTTSSGGSTTTSVGHGVNQSLTQGGSAGLDFSAGIGIINAGAKFGANRSMTTGESINWGTATTSNWGVANSTSHVETHGEATTHGQADTTGEATTNGTSIAHSRVVTSMHAETETTGYARSQSQSWGRGHSESEVEGLGRSVMGGETLGAGLTLGVAPGISVNRTYQVEDDLADRLTEVMRGFEGLLNAASHGGGFITSAYLITESEPGAQAAAALVSEAFYGDSTPTPVMTVAPAEDEQEAVMEAVRALVPYAKPAGDPGDPFDGWLFWKGATLLPADKVAGYVAPAVMREGTLKVIAPIPEGMGFYPQMPGEVVLGHQYSPETGDLTTTPVRLDKPRLMHTLFAGDTGWGKSVGTMRMVYEMAVKWGMRVVVLDFGFAWRMLLNAPGLEGRVDIRQLRPDGVRPLRWNPLQIGRYINPETQLKAFVDIFGAVAQLGQKQQQHRLLDALRQVYVKAGVMVDDPEVRASPQWGRVTALEAHALGLAADTPLGNLSADERQRLAVHRSRAVGLDDLYREIERQYEALPPRDQVGRSVLEGILWRLKSLVRGAPAAQFAAGSDTETVEDLGRPNGVVVLEGGKFLDNFAKAWLLGWAGWLIYSDMVARRERQINRGEADLFMVFEEANIIFTGLDGGDPEARLGPSVSEQYANMFRDSRKYGAYFGVVTQSPSLIPAGIISSCNNLMVGFLKTPKDKDLVISALARSEKGFVDEPWRRFLDDQPIGMVIGRFPYVHKRELQLPFLFRPLMLDVPEPSDEEIEAKLGRITL